MSKDENTPKTIWSVGRLGSWTNDPEVKNNMSNYVCLVGKIYLRTQDVLKIVISEFPDSEIIVNIYPSNNCEPLDFINGDLVYIEGKFRAGYVLADHIRLLED